MLIVDDALLLAVLAGTATSDLREAYMDAAVATTMSWFYRLSRALDDASATGSLGRVFAALGSDTRARVATDLGALPDAVTVLHPRRIVPLMAVLSVDHRLNFLTSEALATALLLDSTICVSTQSNLLDQAAGALDVQVRLMPPG